MSWIEGLQKHISETNVAAVKELISSGEDCEAADFESILHRAFQIQPGSMNVPPNQEVIKALTGSKFVTPIFAAIYNQDTDQIKEIIKEDADQLETTDASSFTPLLRAC